MDKIAVPAAIGFFVLAVINFVVYIKLSKYLYISAGVTKEDARRYASKQAANAPQRLGEWLRRNAKHPKEFSKMFTVCNLSSILFMACFAFAVFSLLMKSNIIVIIGAVVLPLISLAVSVFGFSYGKNLEARFENFYASSVYTPYEDENVPDEINDMDELYMNQESELKRQSTKSPAFRFLPILVFLIFVGFGVWQMVTQSNDSQSNYRQTEEYYTQEQALNIVDIRNNITQSGFTYYEALNEMTQRYPDTFFSDCSAVNESGISLVCCVMNNENTAVSFQQKIRMELEDDFKIDASDREQTVDEADFVFYSLENENGYAFSLRSGYIIVCAKSDADNSSKLKDLLESFGCADKL